MPTIRLHTGPVASFQWSDYPTEFKTATIVGAPPQWDDGSDTTYGISQADTIEFFDHSAVVAPLDLLPANVTADKVTAVRYHLRYRTGHPTTTVDNYRGWTSAIMRADSTASYQDATAFYGYSDATTAGGGSTYPAPADNLIHDYDVTWAFGSFDLGNFLTALTDGALLRVTTVTPSPFKLSAVWVYEAWVEIDYTGSAVVRQLRRRDGLGQTSVARHGAGTRSVTRVIGGPP